jgi:polyphosphate kinase
MGNVEPQPSVPPEAATPAKYFNRELSWISFNLRVLEEAIDSTTPLLERVNFLSIFASNLDEFFQIRVSGLRRQMAATSVEAPPDGMTPTEQLTAISEAMRPALKMFNACWRDELVPKLEEEGIHILAYDALKRKQRKLLRRYFKSEIFPVLTPLASDPGHPFPHISNLSMNLAVVVAEDKLGERFARIKVPQSFPRLIRIPDEDLAERYEKLGLVKVAAPNFVWLEDVIAANLDLLFPGVEVVDAHPFRVTRDADQDIVEDEAPDLLMAMTEYVEQRQFGSAVRLEVDKDMPERVREILLQNLRLQPYQMFRTSGRIGLADVAELMDIERPELKYPPHRPIVPPPLATEESIWSLLKRRDVVLYHPYDSFQPVVQFIQTAAEDPDVLAIKQTLYRVGPNSPIVAALMKARENDKQVSVLVELKARFDEANNISWAQQLERVGVHVVYGVAGLKTHCKVSLVVRRERDGIRRYVHLSTGNYNPVTARIYSDIGLLTCAPEIAGDVSDLFNALTGISRKDDYTKLLVAPVAMRDQLVSRIEREIGVHRQNEGGHIIFKVNALTDRRIIDNLYIASQAGVTIDLQVRSICCLRPGVAGLSENIRVTSIVGRFLEHTRMFYFHNGGEEELLVGSADLMFRNLSRRVEVVFPIEDPQLREALFRDVLMLHLVDEAQLRRVTPDGEYERVSSSNGGEPLNTQEYLLRHGGAWRNTRTTE